MERVKSRFAVYVVALLATGLIVGVPSAAEGEEDNSSLLDTEKVSRFDPWGAPHHRWPELHTSHLGQEKAYYHWSREDRQSLLPEAIETRPLNIWVGGDSLAGGAALGFRELVSRERRWVYTEDVRKSTGVVSDWYFDWIEYLRDEVADGPYQVVVLSIGGNDWQGFRGGPSDKGSAEWVAQYQQRIKKMLETVDRTGRLVIWVGMPHFRIPFMVPLPDVVNPITQEVFHDGDRTAWIDAAAIVSPDGIWTKHILDENGEAIEVRTDDGTHYQSNGARLISAAVVAAIEERSD